MITLIQAIMKSNITENVIKAHPVVPPLQVRRQGARRVVVQIPADQILKKISRKMTKPLQTLATTTRVTRLLLINTITCIQDPLMKTHITAALRMNPLLHALQ